MTDLWMFMGALALAYLLPGPDMILLLETGAARGRRHAVAVAAGLALARAIHVTLAALGLAALYRAAPWTFDLVRWAGAGYLVWLGVQILRSGPLDVAAGGAPARRSPYLGSVRRGLLTNLLNPKALLFCSVLLPQFVSAGTGSLAAQFALLGAILVGTGLGFDLAYAATGASLGRRIARSPRLERLQRGAFAGLLIGFAVRLAAAPRPA